MKRQLLCQYNRVFNADGSVKACGRDECKNLIRLCEETAGKKNCFGSTESGFMNVDAIKNYINTLN